jgi:cell division protein FtsW (lipid II flippase)
MMAGLGKMLIYLGLALAGVGLLLSLAAKLPWLGHLPGDISIERDHFSFYFPLATCIVVSVVISLVVYFFRR